MEGKNSDSKYLILWLCVGLMAAIIIVGWVWTLRFNFQKINAEIGASNQTAEQAENEVKEMFSKIEAVLNENEKALEKVSVGESETKKEEVKPEAPPAKQ